MGDTARTTEANGLRFAYFEEGTGPLVLLLHGFPDTPHSWDDVRPRLAAKGYRAVSPFMRGYRPTAIPDRDADIETIARDALGLIEALGEKSAIVIGHDWGAAAAYAAASLAPEKVRKLFTLAIPHPASLRRTPRVAWGVRHFFFYKLPGAGRRFASHEFAALRAIYKRWSPEWTPDDAELAPVRECFADPASLEAAMGYYRALPLSVPAYLRKRITVDTVVFGGKSDGLLRREDFEGAGRMFERSYTVEELPGGHFLHREHPGAFAERLMAHL
ncbi:MAG TPA: alpha/beta hydrolase [Polyangiaceae bacterium]